MLFNVDFRVNDEFSFSAFGVYNVGESDRLMGIGAKYKYSDKLESKLYGRRFRGADASQFGRWRNNDHVELGLFFKF